MHSQISDYFIENHRRLERLLNDSSGSAPAVDLKLFDDFRAGLLKHIGIEEKILLPAMKARLNGKPHPSAATLRLEHGALAALLVPTPNKIAIRIIKHILDHHNKSEEEIGGLYESCDELIADQSDDLLLKARNYPDVPLMPYSDDPKVLDATRRAVTRAGYNYDNFVR